MTEIEPPGNASRISAGETDTPVRPGACPHGLSATLGACPSCGAVVTEVQPVRAAQEEPPDPEAQLRKERERELLRESVEMVALGHSVGQVTAMLQRGGWEGDSHDARALYADLEGRVARATRTRRRNAVKGLRLGLGLAGLSAAFVAILLFPPSFLPPPDYIGINIGGVVWLFLLIGRSLRDLWRWNRPLNDKEQQEIVAELTGVAKTGMYMGASDDRFKAHSQPTSEVLPDGDLSW